MNWYWRFLRVIAVSVLGSCAASKPPMVWENTAKSDRQFHGDRAECTAMSAAGGNLPAAPVWNASIQTNAPIIAAQNQRNQIFNDCMYGKGWTLVPKKSREK